MRGETCDHVYFIHTPTFPPCTVPHCHHAPHHMSTMNLAMCQPGICMHTYLCIYHVSIMCCIIVSYVIPNYGVLQIYNFTTEKYWLPLKLILLPIWYSFQLIKVSQEMYVRLEDDVKQAERTVRTSSQGEISFICRKKNIKEHKRWVRQGVHVIFKELIFKLLSKIQDKFLFD